MIMIDIKQISKIMLLTGILFSTSTSADSRGNEKSGWLNSIFSTSYVDSILDGVKSVDCQQVGGPKQAPQLVDSFDLISSLNKEDYDSIVDMADESYTLAKMHTKAEKERDALNDKAVRIIDELGSRGWDEQSMLFSEIQKTDGKQTRSVLDAACGVNYNPGSNLAVVNIHGSRSNEDWNTNFNNDPVILAALGIEGLQGLDPNIKVHKGYGNEVKAMFGNMVNGIEQVFQDAQRLGKPLPRLVVTGHSKGGAMANLVAPLVKFYFERRGVDIDVGSIAFSAPDTFVGSKAIEWAHQTMGKRNMLNIAVDGDLLTHANLPIKGYKRVGTIVTDDPDKVKDRLRTKNGIKPNLLSKLHIYEGLKPFGGIASQHYGSKMKASGFEFDPDAVMPFEELREKVRSH